MKKEVLITPTNEQQAIIDALVKDNKNVIVNAVAGSGKTTTILFLAKQNPNKKIVVLTYNKKLQVETTIRIKKMGLENIKIFTFHAYTGYVFNKVGEINNDQKMIDCLENGDFKELQADIYVYDEMQDCIPYYFELIKKTKPKNCKWLVLGDVKQKIYEYNDADERFLTMFDQLVDEECVNLKLTESQRVPSDVCHFINKYCFKEEYIKPSSVNINKGAVHYCALKNSFTDLDFVLQWIQIIKETKGAKDEDFFILTASTKSINNNTPSKLLENKLCEIGYKCFYPSSDTYALKDEEIENKIVFSTFHQAKGRERDYVIILDFSSNYFKYFAKNSNPLEFPNTHYVGLTRVKKEILICQTPVDNFSPILPYLGENFIKEIKKDKNIIFYNPFDMNFENLLLFNVKNNITINTEATSFMKNVKSKTIHEIRNLINKYDLIKVLNEPERKISVRETLRTRGLKFSGMMTVSLSALNADYLFFEFLARNSKLNKSIWENISIKNEKWIRFELLNDKDNLERVLRKSKNQETDITHKKLMTANLNISRREGLHNNITNLNINDYDWMDKFKNYKTIDKRFANVLDFDKSLLLEISLGLDSQLLRNSVWMQEYIKKLETKASNKIHSIKYVGRIDFVNGENIFELKCVNELKIEHIFQSIFYLYLINLIKELSTDKKYDSLITEDEKKQNKTIFSDVKEINLFNIKTNEWLQIKNEKKHIEEIVEEMILSNLKISNKSTNKKFLLTYKTQKQN